MEITMLQSVLDDLGLTREVIEMINADDWIKVPIQPLDPEQCRDLHERRRSHGPGDG